AVFVVYVVLPIIGIAIGIAAVLAVIASGSGIVAGIKNFVETLGLAQIEARKKTEAEPFPPVTKPLFSRFNQNPQPAFLIYFYDAAWSVIDYTRRNVWVNTGRDAQSWFDRG